MKRHLLTIFACLLLANSASVAGEYPRDDRQIHGILAHVAMSDLAPETETKRSRDWGYLKGIGAEAMLEDDYPVLWRPRFEAVTGNLSHEEAALGQVVPSDSSLTRFRGGIDCLYRIPLGNKIALEPFFGGEAQFLNHKVKGGSVGSALFEGYRNTSYGVSARAGVRFAMNELGTVPYEEPSSDIPIRVFHAEIGLVVPFYYDKHERGLRRDTLVPGASPAFFIEGGGRIGNFRPAIYYEGLRFGFERETLGKAQTSIDLIGVRLGYAF